VIFYPDVFEDWWLARAGEATPKASVGQVLSRHESVVARLSDAFTLERDHAAPDVYRSRQEIDAYGLFFFPQTFCRSARVVRELIEDAGWSPPVGRPLRMLDLGCGSGGASFGFLHQLVQSFPEVHVEHVGVDRSPDNLETARACASNCVKETSIKWNWMRRDITGSGFSWEKAPFNQPWDVILLGFSFGELVAGVEEEAVPGILLEMADSLAPEGVAVILEPALMETSVRLEKCRDAVAATGSYRILGPCLHHAACPALAGKQFWCHEVRRWRPPESLAALNTRLHREIRFLKFSFLAFSKGESPSATGPEHFRLVSPIAKKSGQLICKGCAGDGQIHTYEWLTRNLSKKEIKDDLGLERGDRVHTPELKPLADGERQRVEKPPTPTSREQVNTD